jgi:hypothetical protein
MASSETPTPSPFAYVLSFLIVGLCWGFTTPFIRRAALTYSTPTHPSITDPRRSWLTRQLAKAFFTVVGLLKRPGYAIPLLCNLTGSVWFFLLVGKAGEDFFYRSSLSCFVITGIRSFRQVTTGFLVLERALCHARLRAIYSTELFELGFSCRVYNPKLSTLLTSIVSPQSSPLLYQLQIRWPSSSQSWVIGMWTARSSAGTHGLAWRLCARASGGYSLQKANLSYFVPPEVWIC